MDQRSLLSARERQIMDVIYSLGEATATQVMQEIADPPSRSAVRTFLRILEEKGHLKHREQKREYIYFPTKTKKKVGRSAVQHVLDTFFDGSLETAVANYLSNPKTDISDDELKQLEKMIREARKRGQ